MRFKKGDKVWMISTNSTGVIIPSMRGTVTALDTRHNVSPRMMVQLENGDVIIHNVEDDPASLVKFRMDWGSIAQSGRATDF